MPQELALMGGPPAVTVDASDRHRRSVAEEKAAVNKLIDEGFLSGAGAGLPLEFEEEFKEYIGCKYVLTTSHGHTALASCYFAAGLGAGDEFIHPTIGYLGSYAGALHMGATPVFCELDPHTLLADIADIESRITPKTRVINPIHMCGRVCDMDALLEICARHNVVLVEDAAHAAGSEWGGIKIGNLGHIAGFSCQGVGPRGKPLSAGEGGIVATNDRELYERALIYCHLHRTGALEELTNPTYREMDLQLLGWKWRAHPLAMAIAKVSFASLPERIAKFIAAREELHAGMAGVPGVAPPRNHPKSKGAELYGGLKFTYEPERLGGLPAARLCEALNAEGVPMRAGGFSHLEHLRALFTNDLPGLWGEGHPGPADIPLPRYKEGDYPVSEGLNDRVLSLGGWIEPHDGLIGQVAEAIHKVVDGHKQLL
ncbi:MAG: aminotransferase class I/II-fold pyridoxal phosphate-dependent enzyme [Candidatus Brocadiia bacterium]|nr:aminotransferase class I/II-fold pyridoxal phosphate-dependent enzyme [Candidatus Brocadiia bacterium]